MFRTSFHVRTTGNGRYGELKQTYLVILHNFSWTPATVFDKIILLVCHDTPIYCIAVYYTQLADLMHAAETI